MAVKKSSAPSVEAAVDPPCRKSSSEKGKSKLPPLIQRITPESLRCPETCAALLPEILATEDSTLFFRFCQVVCPPPAFPPEPLCTVLLRTPAIPAAQAGGDAVQAETAPHLTLLLRVCETLRLDVLDDLRETCRRITGPMDVLTDILLALLSMPHSWLRTLCYKVFQTYCKQMTPLSFQLLLDALVPTPDDAEEDEEGPESESDELMAIKEKRLQSRDSTPRLHAGPVQIEEEEVSMDSEEEVDNDDDDDDDNDDDDDDDDDDDAEEANDDDDEDESVADEDMGDENLQNDNKNQDDEDEKSDMDDEAMFKLDEFFSSMIRKKKQENDQGSFQYRVCDFLFVYMKGHPESEHLLTLLERIETLPVHLQTKLLRVAGEIKWPWTPALEPWGVCLLDMWPRSQALVLHCAQGLFATTAVVVELLVTQWRKHLPCLQTLAKQRPRACSALFGPLLAHLGTHPRAETSKVLLPLLTRMLQHQTEFAAADLRAFAPVLATSLHTDTARTLALLTFGKQLIKRALKSASVDAAFWSQLLEPLLAPLPSASSGVAGKNMSLHKKKMQHIKDIQAMLKKATVVQAAGAPKGGK